MIIDPPWVPEHTPDWFWTMIEKADGEPEKLRALAQSLTKEDLKDAFDYYMSLASFVMTEELDEDPALDLANWIVAQGKELYFAIFEGAHPPPARRAHRTRRGLLRRPGGRLLGTFSDRAHLIHERPSTSC